jgi:hypothetical protein
MDNFKLTPDVMQRLTAQFKNFLSEREKTRALLGDYVADYRAFKGTALARQEYLREKYATRAPNLTHLVFDADGELYWGAADIAILLGRDSTTVTRMMRKIETLGGWRVRLCALRKRQSGSAAPVYVYKKEIFDFIIDFYEEEYLQRFVAPHDLPDMREIPPLTLKEILRLVVNKLYSLKMGAFFTILFAFCYELYRRWSFLYLLMPFLFLSVFAVCVSLTRRGKFNFDYLLNIGSGALLFCFLWFVGLLANDGAIRAPQGSEP